VVDPPLSDTEDNEMVSVPKKEVGCDDSVDTTTDEDVSYWSYSDSDSDSDGGASLYPQDEEEEDEDSDEVSDGDHYADHAGRAFPGGAILDDDFIRGEIEDALGF
jgi:hypothetical protein